MNDIIKNIEAAQLKESSTRISRRRYCKSLRKDQRRKP